MEATITPEPRPDERRALLAALERLLAERAGGHPAYGSGWRRAGIREATTAAPYAPQR